MSTVTRSEPPPTLIEVLTAVVALVVDGCRSQEKLEPMPAPPVSVKHECNRDVKRLPSNPLGRWADVSL